MLQQMMNISLTIAVIGFGLAVLAPAILNVIYYNNNIISSFKNKILSKICWFLITSLTSILYALYYAVSLYYIWI